MRFRERAAENREVLAEYVDDAAVDAAVARDDAVAGDAPVPKPEVRAAVLDEAVQLHEAPLVEEDLEAFPRAQLAARVLAGEGGRRGAHLRQPAEKLLSVRLRGRTVHQHADLGGAPHDGSSGFGTQAARHALDFRPRLEVRRERGRNRQLRAIERGEHEERRIVCQRRHNVVPQCLSVSSLIIRDKSPPRRARADAVRRKADHAMVRREALETTQSSRFGPRLAPQHDHVVQPVVEELRGDGEDAGRGRRRREDDVGLRGRDGFDGSLEGREPGVVALVPHEQAAVLPNRSRERIHGASESDPVRLQHGHPPEPQFLQRPAREFLRNVQDARIRVVKGVRRRRGP